MINQLAGTIFAPLGYPMTLVTSTMDRLDEVWDPFVMEDDGVEVHGFGVDG